jgi:hypothetical protein
MSGEWETHSMGTVKLRDRSNPSEDKIIHYSIGNMSGDMPFDPNTETSSVHHSFCLLHGVEEISLLKIKIRNPPDSDVVDERLRHYVCQLYDEQYEIKRKLFEWLKDELESKESKVG